VSEECSRVAQILLEQGCDHLRTRAFEAAVDAFTICTLIDPETVEACYGRGMAHVELENWPAAESDFERCLRMQPDGVRAYIQLALLYSELGILSRGRKYFRSALAHRPTPAERRFIEAQLEKQEQERYY